MFLSKSQKHALLQILEDAEVLIPLFEDGTLDRDEVETLTNKIKTEQVVTEFADGQVFIQDYVKEGADEARSFVVKGKTFELKDELKDLGGRWNGGLGGWIFGISKKDEVEEYLSNIEIGS